MYELDDVTGHMALEDKEDFFFDEYEDDEDFEEYEEYEEYKEPFMTYKGWAS